MPPVLRGATAKTRLQEIKENLNVSFKEISNAENTNNERETQTEWQAQVHDALCYTLERCDEFEERIQQSEKLCEVIREETEVAFETFEKRASNLSEEIANTRELFDKNNPINDSDPELSRLLNSNLDTDQLSRLEDKIYARLKV